MSGKLGWTEARSICGAALDQQRVRGESRIRLLVRDAEDLIMGYWKLAVPVGLFGQFLQSLWMMPAFDVSGFEKVPVVGKDCLEV